MITLDTIYCSITCVPIVCRYAASMWTISINSAINTGENAHYDESCSSTLASTFSNGAKDPNTGVVSTNVVGVLKFLPILSKITVTAIMPEVDR